jgi:hypothetical protein
MFKSDKIMGAGFVNISYSTKRLTNAQKISFSLSSNLHDIIIGGILGDFFISKRHNNARLQFKQGLVYKEYLYHLFDLFSSYSNMKEPRQNEYLDKRSNKVFYSVNFNTYSLPCLNIYYELFYINRVK